MIVSFYYYCYAQTLYFSLQLVLPVLNTISVPPEKLSACFTLFTDDPLQTLDAEQIVEPDEL